MLNTIDKEKVQNYVFKDERGINVTVSLQFHELGLGSWLDDFKDSLTIGFE